MRRERWIALGVFAVTLAAFLPALGNDFVAFDDPDLVLEHPVVRQGLHPDGIVWAFTTGYSTNWVPLASLSHMLDVSLFGMAPAGHHATSILLHALAAALVFLWLRGMTRDDARSAAVTLLFALHPLRVESVVWVSERRDVLAMVFGLAALLAWTRYVQHRSPRAFAGALLAYAGSLLSKPTLVTLPVLLLVLDHWPLARHAGAAAPSRRRLLTEKLPFLGLALVVSGLTVLAQQSALSAVEALPLVLRIENAMVAAAIYLGQLFWPVDLAVLVPHPGVIPGARVGAASLLLGAITGLAFVARRSHPWLISGWAWYGIALLPMIGIVQVGIQAHADRYTYVPLLGIAWALVFSIPDGAGATRARRIAVAAGSLAVLLALLAVTERQIRIWRSSVSLFEHAVRVVPDNAPALRMLGVSLAREGRLAEAEARYREALRLRPGNVDARYDLALVLARQGRRGEARSELQRLLDAAPDEARAHGLLGTILAEEGDAAAALPHFRSAVRAEPGNAAARRNLGLAFAQAGLGAEAEAELETALRLEPGSADAHNWLGYLLAARGDTDAARRHFEAALRIAPDHGDARANLSRLSGPGAAP